MIQKNHKVTQRDKKQRKERVLHTRVSEKLDAELRDRAAGLGVSVSNLVRNILLNTVEMVEDIVADSTSVARAATQDKGEDKREPAPPPVIVGWQELTLNLNALCAACNAMLPQGSTAAMAVFSGPAHPQFRCSDCIPRVPTVEEDQA